MPGPFDHLDRATQLRVAEILRLFNEASTVSRAVEEQTGFVATLARSHMLDAILHLISAVTDCSEIAQHKATHLENAEDHLRRSVAEQAEVAARYRIADVASKWDEYVSMVMPPRDEALAEDSSPRHAELEGLRQRIAALMSDARRRPRTWDEALGSTSSALQAIGMVAELDAALNRLLAARGQESEHELSASEGRESGYVPLNSDETPVSSELEAGRDPNPRRRAPSTMSDVARPAIAVSQLDFSGLDDAEFERLVFSLLASSDRWVNPVWVTETRAPDRGRDIEVERVVEDELLGTTRQRIFVQCRHRRKSVTVTDCMAALAPVMLWEPPAVDLLIIATSGRFTTDAVQWVAVHNASSSRRTALVMWPDSHLEMLLAGRQELISEFNLKPKA